jgi:hypothetical protein
MPGISVLPSDREIKFHILIREQVSQHHQYHCVLLLFATLQKYLLQVLMGLSCILVMKDEHGGLLSFPHLFQDQ